PIAPNSSRLPLLTQHNPVASAVGYSLAWRRLLLSGAIHCACVSHPAKVSVTTTVTEAWSVAGPALQTPPPNKPHFYNVGQDCVGKQHESNQRPIEPWQRRDPERRPSRCEWQCDPHHADDDRRRD